MNPSFLLFFLMWVLSFALPAYAQDLTDLDKCLQGGATDDQVKCLRTIHTKEDARLNILYRRAMQNAAMVSAGTAGRLKKSELTWIKFRDEWCVFEQLWEQGSLGKIAFMYCKARETRRRADQLRLYAEASKAPVAAPDK